jgi:hypothetical protein
MSSLKLYSYILLQIVAVSTPETNEISKHFRSFYLVKMSGYITIINYKWTRVPKALLDNFENNVSYYRKHPFLGQDFS